MSDTFVPLIDREPPRGELWGAEVLDRAARQAGENRVSLIRWRRSVDMLGEYRGAPEFVPQMDRMAHAARKNDRGASLAEPEPVSHNITDQLGHIHSRGQILFYVIAALNTDPGQIRPGWRVNLGPDQKTASD